MGHDALQDHARRGVPVSLQLVDPPLDGLGVVELDGVYAICGPRRDALFVARPHADHEGVVVPVIGAEHLYDVVMARDCACDPDRAHRRLRARVGEAPAREPEAPGQFLGHHDRVLGGRGEVSAAPEAFAHRCSDGRMGVALEHRAEAVVKVEVLVAVDIPDALPLAVTEVDRPWRSGLIGGRHSAGQHLFGPRERCGRGGRALVEQSGFALAQPANLLA